MVTTWEQVSSRSLPPRAVQEPSPSLKHGLEISALEDQKYQRQNEVFEQWCGGHSARLLAKPKPFGTCPDDDTDRNRAQAQSDSAVLTNV